MGDIKEKIKLVRRNTSNNNNNIKIHDAYHFTIDIFSLVTKSFSLVLWKN